jgi:hypothetical protein
VLLRGQDRRLPAASTSAHSRALCVVDVALEGFVHHAALCSRAFYSSLRLWLDQQDRYVEEAVTALAREGFTVALTGEDAKPAGAPPYGRPRGGGRSPAV